MSLFLHSTLFLSFYIDVVLTLSKGNFLVPMALGCRIVTDISLNSIQVVLLMINLQIHIGADNGLMPISEISDHPDIRRMNSSLAQ